MTTTDGTPFTVAIIVDENASDSQAGFATNLASFSPTSVTFTIGGVEVTPTNSVISFLDGVGGGNDQIQFQGNVTLSGITQRISAVATIPGTSYELFDDTSADLPPLFATSNPIVFQGSGVVGHNTFTIPADAPVTSTAQAAPPVATYARFRLSTSGGLAPTGPAVDGEVEDHQLTLTAGNEILLEPFDNSNQFTASEPFFSDTAISTGSDFFGISDGAGGGDFGTGDPAQTDVKAYTGLTGNFLTGMDLDGEGATLPITINWTGLNISGETGLQFGGDFAEFFDISTGWVDESDFIRVEAQIDGGGFVNILEFRGRSIGGTNAAIFSVDTDNDGIGDGTPLQRRSEEFHRRHSRNRQSARFANLRQSEWRRRRFRDRQRECYRQQPHRSVCR